MDEKGRCITTTSLAQMMPYSFSFAAANCKRQVYYALGCTHCHCCALLLDYSIRGARSRSEGRVEYSRPTCVCPSFALLLLLFSDDVHFKALQYRVTSFTPLLTSVPRVDPRVDPRVKGRSNRKRRKKERKKPFSLFPSF